MEIQVDIQAQVALAAGVEAAFGPLVEVSLDCAHCQRSHRTVLFREPGLAGVCTPSGHAFPGRVGPLRQGPAPGGGLQAIVRLSYAFSPFTDLKHPAWIPAPLPTWGRLHFRTTCPGCGEEAGHSLQTNTVLPWTCRCPCGRELFTEREIFPGFSLVPESAD